MGLVRYRYLQTRLIPVMRRSYLHYHEHLTTLLLCFSASEIEIASLKLHFVASQVFNRDFLMKKVFIKREHSTKLQSLCSMYTPLNV